MEASASLPSLDLEPFAHQLSQVRQGVQLSLNLFTHHMTCLQCTNPGTHKWTQCILDTHAYEQMSVRNTISKVVVCKVAFKCSVSYHNSRHVSFHTLFQPRVLLVPNTLSPFLFHCSVIRMSMDGTCYLKDREVPFSFRLSAGLTGSKPPVSRFQERNKNHEW